MEILLATGNAHKKEELERILVPHRVLIPGDIGIAFHAEETGSTYLENALIKVRALALAAGAAGELRDSRGNIRAVLADDSGISVPALGGAPGVYSARYGSAEAGRDLEAPERNALLLKNMSGFFGDSRRAFFVCCMVLHADEYREFSAQETFSGIIAGEPGGSGGFGYDPIFYIPERGCTVAELEAGEKDRISHRGRSGLRIRSILDSLEKNP
jgi:XTP/dITP diphosphohydrolase